MRADTATSQKPWDLSPVFELLQSIAPREDGLSPVGTSRGPKTEKTQSISTKLERASEGGPDEDPVDDEKDQGVKLGDFNKLWDYFGIEKNPSRSYTPSFDAGRRTAADAYTSDGALYYPPASKAVKGRDEENGQDLAETQYESPTGDGPLTKNQRKNRNRRLKKKETKHATGWSESEDDSRPPARRAALKEGAQKKAADVATSLATSDAGTSKINSQRAPVGTPNPQTTATASAAVETAKKATEPAESSESNKQTPSLESNKQTPSTATLSWLDRANQLRQTPTLFAQPVTPSKATTSATSIVTTPATVIPTAPKSFFSTPTRPSNQRSQSQNIYSQSVPHSYSYKNVYATPDKKPATDKPAESFDDMISKAADSLSSAMKQTSIPNNMTVRHTIKAPTQTADLSNFPVISRGPTTATPQRRYRQEILPLQSHTTDDRNWLLLLKLLNNFPQDRRHLLSPLQLSINQPHAHGIHVFVDASNILIGFQEHLRRARGIPEHVHIERIHPSFHALALLLERRRPVAKRVLAGSTPEVPAFEQARQVGYETCILDKVYKAKELTDKQRRLALNKQKGYNGYSSAADVSDGYTSEDAVKQVTKQKPRWVEQAVDEILHLKILESIVDTPADAVTAKADGSGDIDDEKRPTMVLATGDAAVAEYSSGFLKMVERGLKQGWNVEVMAWNDTVSSDYRRLQQHPKWRGGRFKIIPLDEYAEELFST